MAEYIEREAVIADLKEQVEKGREKGRDTAEYEAAELVFQRFAEYIKSFPTADVQPLDVVCKEIAELIGNPCRIVRATSVMMPNCDDCSVEVNSTECWKRYFKRKFAKEG